MTMQEFDIDIDSPDDDIDRRLEAFSGASTTRRTLIRECDDWMCGHCGARGQRGDLCTRCRITWFYSAHCPRKLETLEQSRQLVTNVRRDLTFVGTGMWSVGKFNWHHVVEA